jgi:hypothetical protein
MHDLVQRLSQGRHPVEVSLRPDRTVKALEECLKRGHVHIRFTSTRGGTELGVPLDQHQTDTSSADFGTQTGTVRVVGELTLDYVPVRCVADISLPSMEGEGYLEIIGEPVDRA